MPLHAAPFVGSSQWARPVGECLVALTTYAQVAELEDWHAHAQASLSLLVHGTHTEELGGRTHQRVPGDLKLVPAGQLHRCSHYAPGTRKLNVSLPEPLLRELGVGETHLASLLVKPPTKAALVKLYQAAAVAGDPADSSAQLLLYELLGRPVAPRRVRNPPAWVNTLAERLHDDWHTDLPLAELAAGVGLHPVSLSRYFPHYFAVTLSCYRQQLKVARALALLKNTALSLTEVAYACGFADQSHFTRLFKQHTGYLPKVFRQL